ncbi:zwei Ig domain protein zig-8-like isoform X2 [Daktulosphaira vitifoliae]|uniref:zwei Ig domain protein zig-8-like isoform X2 n=1 Tax=Daktulosphaira vitifoliae TaxID=58002 RepID=UPI0021AACF1F|nr:zwei Ig domain protein zig-8-like isoform X2 [Daktulosphaira vitifoliae]
MKYACSGSIVIPHRNIFYWRCSYQGNGDSKNSNGVSGGRNVNVVKLDVDQSIGPQFDSETPRNVTALEGKSAYLTCKVNHLDNKTVSWIRHRDIHILTVGAYTYTSDQRFQAIHHRSHSDQWTLHIKWAQKRDAGIYECQVSTQPVRSIFVTLNVVDSVPPFHSHEDLLDMMIGDGDATKVPSASISGGPDIHVNEGSTINLTCVVKFSPEPPASIFWYHYDEVISYDSTRGGVSVVTEKGDMTVSYLLIQDAVQSDSGKYSCIPSNADVSSVVVHVLNGESPAAMQTGSAGLSNSSITILCVMILSWTFTRTDVQLR